MWLQAQLQQNEADLRLAHEEKLHELETRKLQLQNEAARLEIQRMAEARQNHQNQYTS